MATEIYPVVHINDERTQAIDQTGVALELGADGVYLIDHVSTTPDILASVLKEALQEYPKSFIGINVLCSPSAYATFTYLLEARAKEEIDRYPDGVWMDDADVSAAETLELRADNPDISSVRYLGGVAFKYTNKFTEEPRKSAREAKRMAGFVDVVTTSGAGTGHPPSPAKIKAMKQAIGEQPLAVASGVSSSNLEEFEGLIDQLLVATSVETTPGSGVFDKAKLAELIELAQSL